MPSTPGSFAVADWVSLDCLRLLTNMLEATSYANFTYQDEFKKEYAPGDTIRVKFPQEWRVFDTFAFQGQAINRQTTTVTIDQPMQVPFEWDSIEEALKLERSQKQIRKEYHEPAMAQLAQECELRWMDFVFFNTPNVVGTLASVPTAWQTYAQCRQRLVELGAWSYNSKRGMIISPAMQQTMATNQITNFNPTDELSREFKTGSIGMAAGFSWFESMACRRHTTGVWADYTAVTVNGAGQSGASINFNATTGDTFLRGDIINLASVNYVNPRTKRSTGTLRQFKITANATAAASAVTLSIYPSIVTSGPYQNVDAGPGTLAAATFWPGTSFTNGSGRTGTLGLGIVKDGSCAMAGIELMIPAEGGAVKIARRAKDPTTGLSIAIISMFDGDLRRQINRFDMLIGFGALYADRAGCLVASSS